MNKLDIKLILFYLVFMMAIKANAQVSPADSIKYAKELSVDLSTKLKFIQNNNSKVYKKLLIDLNKSSVKYFRETDSLRLLAKQIVAEQTGDGELINYWDVISKDTLKKDGVPLDLFELNKATMLLSQIDEKSKKHSDKSQEKINEAMIKTLSDGWNFFQNSVSKESFFKRILEKLFGKTK